VRSLAVWLVLELVGLEVGLVVVAVVDFVVSVVVVALEVGVAVAVVVVVVVVAAPPWVPLDLQVVVARQVLRGVVVGQAGLYIPQIRRLTCRRRRRLEVQ